MGPTIHFPILTTRLILMQLFKSSVDSITMLVYKRLCFLVLCTNWIFGIRMLKPTTIFKSKRIDSQSWSLMSKRAFFVRSISYCAQVCVRNAAECRAFIYRRAIRECELTYADRPKKFVILGEHVSVTEYSSVHLSNIIWGTGTESFGIAFNFWG